MPDTQFLLFDSLSEPRKGLIIRQPWATLVVSGDKTWEIRGFRAHFRGPIAIIAGGTGTVVGSCELVDCLGPLSLATYNSCRRLRGSPDEIVETLPYPNTYAWVMTHPRKLQHPVPYPHPKGAVIWVKLPDETRQFMLNADKGP